MGTKVTMIKDAEFDTRVAASGVVLVDFMAQWCGPCHQMAPVLEQVAEEYVIDIVKLDVDQDPESAKRLGIRALPTFVIYKDGQEVERKVGTFTLTQMASMIEEHLA